jgi:hypothetical protein
MHEHDLIQNIKLALVLLNMEVVPAFGERRAAPSDPTPIYDRLVDEFWPARVIVVMP